MPRGRPKKDTTDSEKEISSFEDKIDDKIDVLCVSLQNVSDKLDRFFEGRLSSRELPNVPELETEPSPPPPSYPVPTEFRAVVDEILNKEFGVEVVPISDSPAFHFMVNVPDKYSTISEEFRRMYKKDMRTKVVTYSEGAVGVRAYLDKIWTSFNPTIQALIVNDRRI
jgi:hypothetical protein